METTNETSEYKLHLTGFHATEQRSADAILNKQEFRDSHKDNEWLGYGVYFFKYHANAEWWADVIVSRRSKAVILKANLEYTKEQMLDLDDPDQFGLLNTTYKIAMERANELSIAKAYSPIEMKKQWCFACNLYRQLYPQIGIISFTFKKKPMSIPGMQVSECQLCVSNHDIIGSVEYS